MIPLVVGVALGIAAEYFFGAKVTAFYQSVVAKVKSFKL